MTKKTSADYQREYRKRLREQGLVKREVWIHPDHTSLLGQAEKKLRKKDFSDFDLLPGISSLGESHMNKSRESWTTTRLYRALLDSVLCVGDIAKIELIEGVDQAIQITMHEHGDLSVFLTVVGEQIIVESLLWPTNDVRDVSAFNEAVLKTHKYFPLSTISLDTMSDGLDYYHMFGALSSSSSLDNVVFELEVLANNVIQATSAYSEYLNIALEA